MPGLGQSLNKEEIILAAVISGEAILPSSVVTVAFGSAPIACKQHLNQKHNNDN